MGSYTQKQKRNEEREERIIQIRRGISVTVFLMLKNVWKNKSSKQPKNTSISKCYGHFRFMLVLGPQPAVPQVITLAVHSRNHYWWAWGKIWNAGDQIQVSHVQGKSSPWFPFCSFRCNYRTNIILFFSWLLSNYQIRKQFYLKLY